MPLAATRAPYTLFIVDDDMPLNPREDYDCLGKMVCWHGRYSCLVGSEMCIRDRLAWALLSG